MILLLEIFYWDGILKVHGDDPKICAGAMVEIAACTLKLTRSQKASFHEVMRSCRKVLETVTE